MLGSCRIAGSLRNVIYGRPLNSGGAGCRIHPSPVITMIVFRLAALLSTCPSLPEEIAHGVVVVVAQQLLRGVLHACRQLLIVLDGGDMDRGPPRSGADRRRVPFGERKGVSRGPAPSRLPSQRRVISAFRLESTRPLAAPTAHQRNVPRLIPVGADGLHRGFRY